MRLRPSGKFIFLWFSIGMLLLAVIYKYAFVSIKNTPEQNALVVQSKLTSELDEIEPLIVKIRETLQ